MFMIMFMPNDFFLFLITLLVGLINYISKVMTTKWATSSEKEKDYNTYFYSMCVNMQYSYKNNTENV